MAPILRVLPPLDQSAGDQAICKLNRRIVSDPKPLGELANSYLIFRGPFDREQGLVLLRSQADTGGRLLTKLQKTTQMVPELSHSLVICGLKHPISSNDTRDDARGNFVTA